MLPNNKIGGLMKVIINYEEQMGAYLGQYASQIEPLGKEFALLEIDKKHLSWVNAMAKKVEMNSTFSINSLKDHLDIHSKDALEHTLLEQDNMIIAFIGCNQRNSLITHSYNINTKIFKQINFNHLKNNNPQLPIKNYYINCFSETHKSDTIHLLKCISFLTDLSQELNKSLIIYAGIDVPHRNSNPIPLSSYLINQYLEAAKSILIIDPGKENKIFKDISTNTISQYIIENTRGINDSICKAASILKVLKSNPANTILKEEKATNHSQTLRPLSTLYNDYFYLNIDPNEEIYVSLLAEASPDPRFYEELGFQYIILETGLRLLYGKRSEFDRHNQNIRGFVSSDYQLDILTHAPCVRDTTQPMIPYFLPPETQSYTGRGVYIGIITTDPIDYTNPVLRNPDGSTRIAYIWNQVRSTEGNIYTSEQINAALSSPNPDEIISLPVGESMSTVMAAISGGLNDSLRYRGIAPDAQFLIAKIKPVSAELQRIYGGMPNPKALILYDALIGILNISNFALHEGRPLVLLMPFNGNIDPHDASLLAQQQLAILGRRSGLTLIIPTGDEANKRHHYYIMGEQVGTRRINLEVEAPHQNVVGVIYQWGDNILSANLYPPTGTGRYVNLKEPGISQLGDSIIYSSGENISYSNGTFRILFRLENPEFGEWHIESDIRMGTINRTNLWLAQQELNPYVKLNPYSGLITMGSTSVIPNTISVGAYDFTTNTVVISSGRGDPLSATVVPTLVTYGKSILAPCLSEEWVGITGTVAAASIMAGAIATIYQKYLDEVFLPLPNTIFMNSILVRSVTQFDILQYPNPNQGYGIFSLQTLIDLLSTSIR